MRRLILVKHAAPAIQRDVPARDWELSQAGRDACEALATALRAFAPARIVTSDEAKARQTGAMVGAALGVTVETGADLHEHDRREVALLEPADFHRRVAELFARPDELVLGRETAAAAVTRFRGAVERELARLDGTLAIVAHGTVIALLVAQVTGRPGLALWQALGLPSFVVLRLPAWELEHVANVG